MRFRSRILAMFPLAAALFGSNASSGVPGQLPHAGAVTPLAVTAGGDSCATATVIASLPYNDSGDTTGATDTSPFFLSSACAGGGMLTRPGPDLVYSINVFSGNSLTITLDPGPTYDAALYVVGGSCASGSGCIVESDSGAEGAVETIGPRTFNPGTLYIYVDSIYAPDEGPDHGPYTLSVTGTLGTPNNTSFYTLTPCRVLDTRGAVGPLGGPALSGGIVRNFTLTGGACAVPATAKSVSINATVTQPTAQGHVVLFPTGGAVPLASTINFRAGQTRANNAIVPLGTNGMISAVSGQPSGNTVHFILDVNGYFQ